MKYWIALAIIFVSFLVSLKSLNGYFVLDDYWLVPSAENRSVVEYFKKPFFADSGYNQPDGRGLSYFRPVIRLSYLADAKISGHDPRGYFATNIIIHLLGMLALFLILAEFKTGARAGALGLAVLGASPIFFAARALIVTRPESLTALFLLLMVLLYARFSGTGKRIYYPAALFCFVVSLGIKESAVAGPFLLMVYIWVFHREKLKNKSFELLPFFFLLILFIIFRLWHSGGFGSLASGVMSISPVKVLGVITANMANYLALFPMVLPIYGNPHVDMWAAARAVTFIMLAVLFIRMPRSRQSSFWIWWFIICSLPAIGMFSYHLLVIPGIGLAVLVGEFISLAYERYRERFKIAAVAGIFGIFACYLWMTIGALDQWISIEARVRDKFKDMAVQISRLEPRAPAGALFFVQRPWEDSDGIFKNSCHGMALDLHLEELFPGRGVSARFFNSVDEIDLDFKHASFFFVYSHGRVREIRRQLD